MYKIGPMRHVRHADFTSVTLLDSYAVCIEKRPFLFACETDNAVLAVECQAEFCVAESVVD